MKPLLVFLLSALPLPVWGQTGSFRDPLRFSPCRAPLVALTITPPVIQRGSNPTYTLLLGNKGTERIQVLDVRQSNFQEHHCILTFLRRGEVVEVMVPFSGVPYVRGDGKDHFWLEPGATIRIKLDMQGGTEDLPPGNYEAAVIFWNPDPGFTKADGFSLSSRARFTVK